MSQIVAPLQILKSLSEATAEVVEKAAPSVVSVNCGMRRGSGVVWSSDGHIVTCNHVIGRHDTARVGLSEGTPIDATVIGRDPYSDVALLKIDEEPKPIEIGDSENLKIGQFVLALANPFNRTPSATSGMITSIGGSLRRWGGMATEDAIVTDAQLNPGYSGGPLIDVSGKMIGLNAALVWSRGIAIPVNAVKSIVDRLKHKGKIRRAYLGIVSNSIQLPPEIAGQTRIEQDGGAIVLSVEKGSPAKKAGLAFGDVIVRFNEKPVADIYDLTRLLTEEVIGKEIKLSVLRGEKLTTLSVVPDAAGVEDDE